MLRKMYLVSADQYLKNVRQLPPPPPPSDVHKPAITSKSRIFEGRRKPTRIIKGRPYEKWVKFREKMRQEDIGRMTRVKAVAGFLKQILPLPTSTSPKTTSPGEHKQRPKKRRRL